MIFVPSFARSGNPTISFKRALPILFICICGFIANDIDDIDKDRVNHPDRPLPTGQLPTAFAVILFFICLGLALFCTKYYVEESISFWYYGLIAMSISYGYVVEGFPSVKALYVATMASIPILIVAAWYPEEKKFYIVAGSLFLLTLGREMCMDLKDRPGDSISILHELNPASIAAIAYSLQTIGLLLLLMQLGNAAGIICLVLMALLLALSGIEWFKRSRYRWAIMLMKAQFLFGLYFLS